MLKHIGATLAFLALTGPAFAQQFEAPKRYGTNFQRAVPAHGHEGTSTGTAPVIGPYVGQMGVPSVPSAYSNTYNTTYGTTYGLPGSGKR